MNHDRRPDVVTAWGLHVVVLLDRRDGSLRAPQAFPVDTADTANDGGVSSLAVGDVNKDQRCDVVAGGLEGVNTPDGIVSVLLGTGTGSFRPPATSHRGEFQPTGVSLSDLNHDGRLDLVTADYVDAQDYGQGAPSNYAAVVVSLGKGNGGFAKRAEYEFATQQSLGGPRVADFNGDGEHDVAVADGGGIDVMLGTGDGSLQAGRQFGQQQWGSAELLAKGDVNHDGLPDLAAGSNAPSVKDVAVFVNASR